jgi:hypothetical protein
LQAGLNCGIFSIGPAPFVQQGCGEHGKSSIFSRQVYMEILVRGENDRKSSLISMENFLAYSAEEQ